LANWWCDISLGYKLSSRHFTELLNPLPFVQQSHMKCCESRSYGKSIYAVFKKDDTMNKIKAESVCGNCISSYLSAYKNESIQHEVYVIRDT
jgi:hypothetical protein